jgi:uncharacterized repeat protein (TIGR01451 family)
MKNLRITSKTNRAAAVRPLVSCLLAALLAAFAPGAKAQGVFNNGHSPTPSVDKRHALRAPALSNEKKNAQHKLEQLVPSVNVSVDPILNSPHWVQANDGFLTGPNGQGRGLANNAQNANGNHQAIVKAFLNEHSALFGHGGEVLDNAKSTRDYVTDHNGIHTMIWQQHLDNIPVFDAVMMAHVTKNGELVNISTYFLPDPAAAAHRDAAARNALKSAPPISAQEALLIASRDVGQYFEADAVETVQQATGPEQTQKFKAAGKLYGDSYVHLSWLPMDANDVRLCWEILVTAGNPIERFRTLVDAQTGEVLVRQNLTRHISNASYRVWTSDSPSPFSPGLSAPSNFQPPVVPRQLVTIAALSTNASPNGWIDDNANTTTGNNVDCFLDRDGNFQADGPRPTGTPNRVFDFNIDLTADPSTYTNASVVQMFYWQNWYHDTMYGYGFTEAAGNYQINNFNRGGLGNDPILAHCQFGAAVGIADNSAFLPAPDGQSGEIIEFIFSGPTPNRDGALDNDVYLHESTHGLSERLVGGGVGITELQPAGMGEGWSDFYALSLLSEPGDNVNGNYAAGGYATYRFFGLSANYYYGVRHYPYSTDMTKSPFTLKDIDPTQISPHLGVPMSPVYSPFSASEADEVHHQGEVWCVTLWDVRANLVKKYGDTAGNQLMLQLVTDGMKLGPANPTFLEARDAIIAADRVDNNGADIKELWAGFAKRGMGVGASVPVNTTTVGVIESFDVPGLGYLTNSIIGGNNNGVVDPNECNNLSIVLTNRSTTTIGNITAKLVSLTTGAFVTQPFSSWSPIAATNAGTCLTPFRISTTPEMVCGTPIDFALIISSDQDVRTNNIRLVVGSVGLPVTYQNNTPMTIPDANTTGIMSPITITNFVGGVAHVTVSMFISHPFDSDLYMELISPDGTKVMLSQFNGGTGDNFGVNCSPSSLRTTFDDDAANPITTANPPFVGTYKPQGVLATFNLKSGTNVNGIWYLHVVDEALLDIGSLNCWSLSLTPYNCTDGGGECPGSDLAASIVDNPDPVLVTSNLTYTMVVSNLGPATAKSVVLNQTLPTSVQFITATTSQGVVTQSLSTVTANLGTIPVYGYATVAVTVVPLTNGIISSTASVGSPSLDGDSSNNSATAITRVEKPTADVAIAMTASPNPALNGGSITYTINITNNGPFTATGVILTNLLPQNSTFISASTSQGTFANFGSSILALLGNLSTGSVATVTFVVSPTSTGILTASAQAAQDPFIIDPVPVNNRATVQTTVNPAADIAVTAFANPDPVVLGSNVTYTITVTNRGPNIASGVALTDLLPSGSTFVSATTTRGTITNQSANVACNMGTMAPGDSGIVTVVVRAPNAAGTLLSIVNVSSTQADPNGGNNSVTLRTTVAPPFVRIVAAGATMTSESLIPRNGIIDIGETVTLQLRLQNTGNSTASALTATMLPTGGVTSPSGVQNYGSLAGGAAASAPFTFTASGTNGGTLTATLQLQTNGVNAGTVTFTFPLPQTTVFSNAAPITIVDATASAPSAANPYPSTIQVSGVTGFVSRVAISLNNLSHTYPDDIGAIVVHPSARPSVLMAHAGGGLAASHLNLTFDRSASVAVPDESQLTSTRYSPAAYGSYAFPTNFTLPAGPYSANMAAFEGVDPNGNWQLFMADDSQGDNGNVAGGWTISITTGTPVNPIAELSVNSGLLGNPLVPVLVGNNVSFQVVVKNNGPFEATAVQVTNLLSAGLSFVSVTAPPFASYTNVGQSILFTVPQLPVGSNAVFTVTAQAIAPGTQSDSINIGANELDLNVGNNSTVQPVTVVLPVADVSLAATASANPLTIGNNLVYNIAVTNNGPNVALNTTLTDTLPAGFAFVSANTTVGSAVANNGVVTIAFGDMAPNAVATASITVAPSIPALVTNTLVLSTASSDVNTVDNSVAIATSVVAPAPMLVLAGVKLTSESGVQNGAVDQNETVTIDITLANVGTASTINPVAILQTNGGVLPIVSGAAYGVIPPGGSATRSFSFIGTLPAGATNFATLAVADSGIGFPWPTISFIVPSTSGFSNGSPITIPSSGPASPYPSTITISGVPGVVSKAVLKLSKVSHSFPHDINVLLVSPTGQSVLALAHCGGAHSITNVDITLDDSAATYLSETGQISSGTFKPSTFTPAATFPGVSTAASGSAMNVLNGSAANGTWSLYVLDDNNGDAGSIGGWSLTLTVANTVNPAAALSLSMTGSTSNVLTGNLIDYVVTVANSGPSTATNIVIANTLPVGVNLISGSISTGTTDITGSVLNLRLPSLASGSSASAFIRVQALSAGTATNSATVSADIADLYPADNSASFISTITQTADAKLDGTYLGSNTFKLVLTGQNGEPYIVQYSEDLTNWVSISTNTPVNGTATINDNAAVSTPRYYRAFRAPH